MLTHPDPVVQKLFNDICEQRDIAMVKAANLQIAVEALTKENAQLKVQLAALIPNPSVIEAMNAAHPSLEGEGKLN